MGGGTESKLADMLVESLPARVLWSLILGLHLATQNSEIPKVYLRYIPRDARGALDLIAHDSQRAGWWATWCGFTAAA